MSIQDSKTPFLGPNSGNNYTNPSQTGPSDNDPLAGSTSTTNANYFSRQNRYLILGSTIVIGLSLFLASILQKTTQEDGTIKVLGVVGVQTTYLSADRRAALRSTWFPVDGDAILRETGLVFVFVIGKTKGQGKIEIEKENDMYGDILILMINQGEDIFLPQKILAFFKAASKKFKAEYYIKVDDDIYLRPDRLVPLLSRKNSKPQEYIGCKKREHIKRNKELVFAHGSIYILSAKAVQPLAKASKGRFDKNISDDIAIGYLMDLLHIELEEHRDLCHSHCTPTSIAVWNFSCSPGSCNPVTKLKELHDSSMCSKTPTTQSEQQFPLTCT